jgi:hypothetical protein
MNKLGLDAANSTGIAGGIRYCNEIAEKYGTMLIASFPKIGFHFSAHDSIFRDDLMVGILVGRNYQVSDVLSF